MLPKRVFINRLIERTKEHILRIAPWIKDVKIVLKKGHKGLYETKIEVKNGKTHLVAKKEDEFIPKGLEKAALAITNQLRKFKTKNTKQNRNLKKAWGII